MRKFRVVINISVDTEIMPLGIDDDVSEDIEEAFRESLYEIDGLEIRSVKVTET